MVAVQLSDKVVRRDIYNNNKSNSKMAIKTHDDDVCCSLGRPQGKMAENVKGKRGNALIKIFWANMCDSVEKLCHYNGRSCDKVALLLYSSLNTQIYHISLVLHIVYRIP